MAPHVIGMSMVGMSMVGMSMIGLSMIGVSMIGLSMVGVSMIGLSMVGVIALLQCSKGSIAQLACFSFFAVRKKKNAKKLISHYIHFPY